MLYIRIDTIPTDPRHPDCWDQTFVSLINRLPEHPLKSIIEKNKNLYLNDKNRFYFDMVEKSKEKLVKFNNREYYEDSEEKMFNDYNIWLNDEAKGSLSINISESCKLDNPGCIHYRIRGVHRYEQQVP